MVDLGILNCLEALFTERLQTERERLFILFKVLFKGFIFFDFINLNISLQSVVNKNFKLPTFVLKIKEVHINWHKFT